MKIINLIVVIVLLIPAMAYSHSGRYPIGIRVTYERGCQADLLSEEELQLKAMFPKMDSLLVKIESSKAGTNTCDILRASVVGADQRFIAINSDDKSFHKVIPANLPLLKKIQMLLKTVKGLK